MHSCAICDGPGSGFFFGVFSCRPCAAFFRRSVKERREYQCRLQGNCPIDKEGMRNSCRACRLKRCIHSGMRADLATSSGVEGGQTSTANSATGADFNEKMPAAIHQQQQISSFSPNTMPGGSATLNFPLATPLIHRLAQSVRDYDEALRAICVQHFGFGVLLGAPHRLITSADCQHLKRITAPLQLALVRNQMGTAAFDALERRQKVELMKEFSLNFCTLGSAEMTVKNFPTAKGELRQLALFPGAVLDQDNYRHFLEGVTGLGKEHQINMGQPLVSRFLEFIQGRYRPLAVCPLEFAALLGIMVANCAVATCCLGQCTAQREQIFAELHSLLIQRSLDGAGHHQPAAEAIQSSVPVRFGLLLSLLTEMATLTKELSGFFDLSRVFLDSAGVINFTEMWDEYFGGQQQQKTTC